MDINDIKNSLEAIDEFRRRNASIVAPIHEVPDRLVRRNEVEAEVLQLFLRLREIICRDNELPNPTSFAEMPDSTRVSNEAEVKFRALMGYIDWRKGR